MLLTQWEKLSPKVKRIVVVVGALAAVFGLVSLFSGNSDDRPKRSSREDIIRHILTDTNTREVGIDALSADIKIVSRENKDLKKELERLKADVGKDDSSRSANDALSRDLARMQEELNKLKEEMSSNPEVTTEDPNSDAQEPGRQKQPITSASSRRSSAGAESGFDTDLSKATPEELFKNAPLPTPPQTDEGETGRRGETKQTSLTIASYASSRSDLVPQEENASEEEIYLPAGSILSGVLINGMDAPTSQGARQDPFPATLRIQSEAILPNRFRADLRECFLIISGYGDMSSERAYLRGESLSCVKENGGVIEARLDSYAVGEDGKAGIRGRLVSKQGQIIAKSLTAGFLSGASEAFDVNKVPTLNLNNTGRTQYQQTDFSSTLLEGAAARGASNALDRIAKFYIAMADSVHPVIEIDAGRQVEIIVSKGTDLRVRGSRGGEERRSK